MPSFWLVWLIAACTVLLGIVLGILLTYCARKAPAADPIDEDARIVELKAALAESRKCLASVRLDHARVCEDFKTKCTDLSNLTAVLAELSKSLNDNDLTEESGKVVPHKIREFHIPSEITRDSKTVLEGA